MKRAIRFVIGAMFGALVGALTALLLAPMSGRDLQARARTRLEALVEQARAAAQMRRAQLQSQLAALTKSAGRGNAGAS